MADAGRNGLHKIVMIDAHDGLTPYFCVTPFDFEELSARPSFEGLLFRTPPKDDSSLVAELYGLAVRNHRSFENLAQIEMSGQFLAENSPVVCMSTELGVGRAHRERTHKLLRCTAAFDRFFKVREALYEK